MFGVPPLGSQCDGNHFHLCCFHVGHMKESVSGSDFLAFSVCFPPFILFQLLSNRPMLHQKQTRIRTEYIVLFVFCTTDELYSAAGLTIAGKSSHICPFVCD